MKSVLLRPLLYSAIAFSLVACKKKVGGGNAQPQASTSQVEEPSDLVESLVPLPVEMAGQVSINKVRTNQNTLPNDSYKAQLKAELSKGSRVPLELLGKAVLEQHFVSAFPITTTENIKSQVEAAWKTLKSFNNDIAVYQSQMEKKFGKRSLYNKEAVSVFDYLADNRFQCFSGTMLNLLIQAAQQKGEVFSKQQLVVIFSKGHIQPGLIKKDADDKNSLVSIETTVRSKHYKNLGQLEELNGSLRVIDAVSFLLSEVFENEILVDEAKAAKFRDSMIQKTAEKYGIKNYKNLETNIAQENQK